jgi:hypothetical protein
MSHRALGIHIKRKYLGREAALEGRTSGLAREQDDCTVLKSREGPQSSSIALNQGMVQLRLFGRLCNLLGPAYRRREPVLPPLDLVDAILLGLGFPEAFWIVPPSAEVVFREISCACLKWSRSVGRVCVAKLFT